MISFVQFDSRGSDLCSIRARGAFRDHLIERTAKVFVWSVRFPRYRPELDQSARSVSRSPNRENSKSCRLVSFDFRDTDPCSIKARGAFRHHLAFARPEGPKTRHSLPSADSCQLDFAN